MKKSFLTCLFLFIFLLTAFSTLAFSEPSNKGEFIINLTNQSGRPIDQNALLSDLAVEIFDGYESKEVKLIDYLSQTINRNRHLKNLASSKTEGGGSSGGIGTGDLLKCVENALKSSSPVEVIKKCGYKHKLTEEINACYLNFKHSPTLLINCLNQDLG